jgi:hypothetical protein
MRAKMEESLEYVCVKKGKVESIERRKDEKREECSDAAVHCRWRIS